MAHRPQQAGVPSLRFHDLQHGRVAAARSPCRAAVYPRGRLDEKHAALAQFRHAVAGALLSLVAVSPTVEITMRAGQGPNQRKRRDSNPRTLAGLSPSR